MTSCSRACCWSPYSCGKAYKCPCHWDDTKPASERNSANRHADPTAREAIRNIMRQHKKGKPR